MPNDTVNKTTPTEIQEDILAAANGETRLERVIRVKVFGKSPLNAYMRFNQKMWRNLPASITGLYPVRRYGDFLHALSRMQDSRAQLLHTFFLRNRPMLELIRRLVKRSNRTGILRVAVLGCSTGPEAYSVAWAIQSARSDLKLILHAVDISEQALRIAKSGMYSVVGPQFAGSSMFDCVTEAEMQELFDRKGYIASVKSWIKEGIRWHVGDVRHPRILSTLGSQDIVVANNFLCHMNASVAERCLRNIAHLVTPQGHLFVSGVDLNIRTKVAKELRWQPIQELLEEIHDGDPRMLSGWPFNYSSLEPLNKKRNDWRLRYATAFQVHPPAKEQDNSRSLIKMNNGTAELGVPDVFSDEESARVSDA